jgi:hypothetical protein
MYIYVYTHTHPLVYICQCVFVSECVCAYVSQEMLSHDHNGEGSRFKKPDTHTGRIDFPYLLADALTASSGERWRRMVEILKSENSEKKKADIMRQKQTGCCAHRLVGRALASNGGFFFYFQKSQGHT